MRLARRTHIAVKKWPMKPAPSVLLKLGSRADAAAGSIVPYEHTDAHDTLVQVAAAASSARTVGVSAERRPRSEGAKPWRFYCVCQWESIIESNNTSRLEVLPAVAAQPLFERWAYRRWSGRTEDRHKGSCMFLVTPRVCKL